MTFVVYGALGGALFLVPIALQVVLRYSPLESGLSLVPITIIMLVFSAVGSLGQSHRATPADERGATRRGWGACSAG